MVYLYHEDTGEDKVAIPENVRSIERPKNTVVVDHGSGLLRYAVIQRVGCRHDKESGRNLPVNGATIGHIIGNRYVPLSNEDVQETQTNDKDYGLVALTDKLSNSLLDDLMAVYSAGDAYQIYVTALLRAVYRDLANEDAERKYADSWASELYPDVTLSRNTLSAFEEDLGRTYSRIEKFMHNRVSRMAENGNIAIDGTFKSASSNVPTLANFSRKPRSKGFMGMSVLYAYDVFTREPVCSKVFKGSHIDTDSYKSFLAESKLSSGVVMWDNDIPLSQMKYILNGKSNIHWLSPLKRGDKRITNNDTLHFTGMFTDKDHDVLYKKIKDGRSWLYSFYDRKKGAQEEKDWFEYHRDKPFDTEETALQFKRQGTIVFRSDFNAPPEFVYRIYDERWIIEECFRLFNTVQMDRDTTNAQNDFSIVGNEFINFFAAIMTSRLVRCFDESGLSKEMEYHKFLDILTSARKIKDEKGNWHFRKLSDAESEVLIKCGLEEAAEAPKPRRGRPRIL